MAVFRVTAEWSGFTGAPGYSVFHFSAIEQSSAQANSAADAVSAFFTSVSEMLPSAVSVRVKSSVEILDEANGDLLNELAVDAQPTVTGMSTGSYSGASGAVVNWLTNDIRKGKRVRGRTFLVPLGSASYDNTGSLVGDTLNKLNAAAVALRSTGPVLQVWARPSGPGASDGAAYIVTGSRVPDLAAILRSRRD
jgi:hypothetical protein